MQSGYKVYFYILSSGRNPIKEFIDSLNKQAQAKIERIFQYVEVYGLLAVLPHVKKVTGTPFWEIRILGKNNIRILYVIPSQTQIVVLHAFSKKSQKTPLHELKLTYQRYQNWLHRMSFDK